MTEMGNPAHALAPKTDGPAREGGRRSGAIEAAAAMGQSEAVLELLTRRPLRWAVTAFQGVRRAFWFVRRPRTLGVHAIPITPEGRLVLVRLRYARGWRLPGGGRSPAEDPRAAVLRELREEIGLVRHGAIEPVGEIEHRPDFKRDTASLFIVRDVEYRPLWSFEVEAVMEAAPEALPEGLSELARTWLDLAGDAIGRRE